MRLSQRLSNSGARRAPKGGALGDAGWGAYDSMTRYTYPFVLDCRGFMLQFLKSLSPHRSL